MYEFEILLPPGMKGRRRALKYAALFNGKIYESPIGKGYAVYFDVKDEENCKQIGHTIDKMELMPELPS